MKYKYQVVSFESLAQDGLLNEYATLAALLFRLLNEKAMKGWEFSGCVSPAGTQGACLIFKQAYPGED